MHACTILCTESNASALPVQGAACLHTPQGQLASGTAPCSLIRLACTSPDPVAVAGCVAALNNICTSGEGIERVCEEVKRAPNVRTYHLHLLSLLCNMSRLS